MTFPTSAKKGSVQPQHWGEVSSRTDLEDTGVSCDNGLHATALPQMEGGVPGGLLKGADVSEDGLTNAKNWAYHS